MCIFHVDTFHICWPKLKKKFHIWLKFYLGKKLRDGKGLIGKGRLMLSRINAIQNFFKGRQSETLNMALKKWLLKYG